MRQKTILRGLSVMSLVSVSFSAEADIFSRIIGGHETSAKPWMASLGFINEVGWNHYCGASVISTNWAITAAHCIDDEYILTDSLRIGTNDLAVFNAKEIYSIVDCIMHPMYVDLTHENDIALLKIGDPVSGPYITLNDATKSPQYEQENKVLEVIGWGTLQSNNSQASATLQKVSVPVVGPDRCNVVYGERPETQICAGYTLGGKDSCFGDSGGPLYAGGDSKPSQVGVVSFGAGCAEVLSYGVYTLISKYLNWIREQGASFETGSGDIMEESTSMGRIVTSTSIPPVMVKESSTVEMAPISTSTPFLNIEASSTMESVPIFIPTIQPTKEITWRPDGKCGVMYPLMNGKASTCDGSSKDMFCCSSLGICGPDDFACKLPGAFNYKTGILVEGTIPTLFWRDDLKCGKPHVVADGTIAECNPNPKLGYYCCFEGMCGSNCPSGSVDYRDHDQLVTIHNQDISNPDQIVTIHQPDISKPNQIVTIHQPDIPKPDQIVTIHQPDISKPAEPIIVSVIEPPPPPPSKLWRLDGRCGYEFPLPDGSPAQCNPNSKRYCCSSGGGCWRDKSSCTDPGAVNYRIPGAVPFAQTIKAWRNDYRCGALYPLQNGMPSVCNPNPKKKRYCCSVNNICNAKCEPGSTNYQVIPEISKTKWRKDYRCGYEFPLPDGSPAQCNPNSKRYCCSSGGTCWRDKSSCTDPGTVNYRKPGAVPFKGTIKEWRNDYRCGPLYLLQNGKPSKCNPKYKKKRYCCSSKNICGTKCGPGSTNYMEKPGTKIKWRNDGRCGYEFPLPDGSPAQCNPNSKRYCCSTGGGCWRDKSSCTDPGTVNYRKPGAVPFMGTIKLWRNDYKCGAMYPLANGMPSKCNPNPKKKRYCCSSKNTCGRKCGPGSTNYMKKPVKNIKWRGDGRCGYEFPLPDGSPAQCNPKSKRYCCSSGGGCWRDKSSCTDPGTVNYRKPGAKPFTKTIKAWRNDFRCGDMYPLANGVPSQCNPDPKKKRYCCSTRNVCGSDCSPGSTSYKQSPAERGEVKWRSDGRCGYEFPLPDGTPAQCNPKSKKYCCSSGGGCWRDRRSCTDPGSVDYRKPGAVPFSKTIKAWRNDYRCGTLYPLQNGMPSVCNPDPKKKRYCCSKNNVCGTDCGQGSLNYMRHGF